MNRFKSDKIIVRLQGGLGNQLFCYSAARRLALVNEAQLVIDDTTGFKRDKLYQRKYELDNFQISARKACTSEKLEPFERYRRGVMKFISSFRRYEKRKYIQQKGFGFDDRLLELEVNGTIYLDGLWQSEKYFKDKANIIKEDLKINSPTDDLNRNMSEQIQNSLSVGVHVRWFGIAEKNIKSYNVTKEYYQRAINLVKNRFDDPNFFIFSDNPINTKKKLGFKDDRNAIIVDHNQASGQAYADLWLMKQCNHLIMANSTFSWWGAWLGETDSSLIIAPDQKRDYQKGYKADGFIPNRWIQL